MIKPIRFAGVALASLLACGTAQVASASIINSYVPFVTTNGTTHTDIITGGDVSHFDAHQNSSVDMSGGQVGFLYLLDSATATITGGDISWLEVFDNGFADVFGIFDLSWLIVGANAHVTIHADNVSYNNGHLSGVWGNGIGFSFWAIGGEYHQAPTIPPTLLPNIKIVSTTAVPEPQPALLLALGLAGMMVIRRASRTAAF